MDDFPDDDDEDDTTTPRQYPSGRKIPRLTQNTTRNVKKEDEEEKRQPARKSFLNQKIRHFKPTTHRQ